MHKPTIVCLIAFLILTSCSAAVQIPTTPTATAIDEPTNTATATRHTPSPTAETCTVSAGLLNFRVGPGTGYEVTRVLKQGEVLTMTGAAYGIKPGKWIEVTTTRNETGWINSIFCQE